MPQNFVVMSSQSAWVLHQVYRDHVVTHPPEMIVSNVDWRPLPGTALGVAVITLSAATPLSRREGGDTREFRQAGRLATTAEIDCTFPLTVTPGTAI